VFFHPLGFGVVPVPRHSGLVIYDGEVPADDPIKEGGFADVRTAYYGDNWSRHNLIYIPDSRIEPLNKFKDPLSKPVTILIERNYFELGISLLDFLSAL
jgi:hypothetical protein